MVDRDFLAPALQLLMAQLEDAFPDIGFSSGYRTVEEQDKLYMQGRSEPGQIVTYARGGNFESQHQWGIAVDFYKNVPGHAYDDNDFFKDVGRMALDLGFGWGGTWDTPDRPHLYIPTWGDDTTKLREIYREPKYFMASDVFNAMLQVDGYLGRNTVSALEMYFRINPDGYFGYPSPTIKALQNWLNKHANYILAYRR